MKKISLLAAFLVAGFSYGQTTSSGFVLNPSFEDGPAVNIPKYQTVDNWKLGGDNAGADGVSVDIKTTNVYAGEGSKALEVTSATSIPITGNDPKLGEWHIKVMSTAYSFAGNSSDDIEVTVGFWAKTTDTDPESEKTDGDMRLIVRDVASGTNKSARVLLTTGAWAYIEKTFTFDEAANYNLTLFLEFGLVDGVTQIDGITTSVTGGASLATQDIVKDDSSVFIYPNPAMNVLNYSAEGVKNIEVYNLLGQKLKAEKAVGSVNTSTFSKGSYILKLIRENGAVSTKRFVKE